MTGGVIDDQQRCSEQGRGSRSDHHPKVDMGESTREKSKGVCGFYGFGEGV